MEIEIVYQTWDGGEPVRLFILPTDYFDPLEPGEAYETDGVPRHNHTCEYLTVPKSKLKWSVERRKGILGTTSMFTQYMDGGESWMNHRIDSDGYEEIIHYTQIGDDRCHIIRTSRAANGPWVVNHNSMVIDLPDGSQEERRFDPPWSSEEIRKYTQSHPCQYMTRQ